MITVISTIRFSVCRQGLFMVEAIGIILYNEDGNLFTPPPPPVHNVNTDEDSETGERTTLKYLSGQQLFAPAEI